MRHSRFTTPFRDLPGNPRPTKDQFAELKAQIEIEGQLQPIDVSKDDEVLDGHSRYDILGDDVKHRVVKGLQTTEEKKAYVYARGGGKQLTAEQQKQRREGQKKLAKAFSAQGFKQKEIAAKLRVSAQWVSKWLPKKSTRGESGQVSHAVATRPSNETPEAIQSRICALRQEGKTLREIGTALNMHSGTISAILKRRGVEKPKPEIGKLPKTVTGRAEYYQRLVANGIKPEAAASRARFGSGPSARRAAQVANSDSQLLKSALDKGTLTIAGAWKLLSTPEKQQQVAIEEAEAKAQAKASNHKPAISHDTPKAETLLALLNATYLDWRGFRQNVLGTGKWIPSQGKKAQEIRKKLDTTMAIVDGVARVIRENQGGMK